MFNAMLVILCIVIPCLEAGAVEIDGVLSPGEWDQAVHVGKLRVAGRADKPVLADVYLLWANGYRGLLVPVDGVTIEACDPDNEYWTLFDGVKEELAVKAFVDAVDCRATAMEFAFAGAAGEHHFNMHTNLNDGESQTGKLPRDVHIRADCQATGVNLSGEVFLYNGMAIVVAEWGPQFVPPLIPVYGGNESGNVYKGSAYCWDSACVFLDRQPSPMYWLELSGYRFGPIVAKEIPISNLPWE